MDDKTIRRKVDSSVYNVKTKLLPFESPINAASLKVFRTTRHYMAPNMIQHNMIL